MRFSVQAYINTNLPYGPFVGQVRRLADELGRPGIIGKRGQTNARVRSKGYVRIVFPTRGLAKQYQTLIAQMWGSSVPTRRFRVP
jgi:hypothetical protein